MWLEIIHLFCPRSMDVLMRLFFLSVLSISFFHSLRDGISLRKPNVGWTWWHAPGWASRDFPIFMFIFYTIVAGYLAGHMGFLFWGIVIIIVHSFHGTFYDLGKNHIEWFYGSPNPPEWYRQLRKLWSWLPWIKPWSVYVERYNQERFEVQLKLYNLRKGK